ncbi:ATP-binding cassette domain-containing protein [Sporosarcina limicola]|uniref:ABC-type multidrug transport system ATPase subunit n=1 Tax=Sporosarcina limicola TaxID=34101 RepID=A0A927MLG6_9BACL|nr:ATP-binding cassette domain-containing protein [Sporosarcina limicola]MBE1556116.1 ABC-type multidrug transport system ATPase subunit [Sporosarcina limicola]
MTVRISLHDVEYSLENQRVIDVISCVFTLGISYVVGGNGAGKSTLLKLISTALEPESGGIIYSRLVHDRLLGTYRQQLDEEEIRRMIGYLPQDFKGHSSMTIQRYLKYIAYHKGIPYHLVESKLKLWMKDSNLYKIRNKKLRHLSGGQLQKVGLIQALINEPRICILDEPFVGLDHTEKAFFKRKIERLSFHSVIIISTHLIEEIGQSANNRLLFMENGKISFLKGVDEVAKVFKRTIGKVEGVID